MKYTIEIHSLGGGSVKPIDTMVSNTMDEAVGLAFYWSATPGCAVRLLSDETPRLPIPLAGKHGSEEKES